MQLGWPMRQSGSAPKAIPALEFGSPPGPRGETSWPATHNTLLMLSPPARAGVGHSSTYTNGVSGNRFSLQIICHGCRRPVTAAWETPGMGNHPCVLIPIERGSIPDTD